MPDGIKIHTPLAHFYLDTTQFILSLNQIWCSICEKCILSVIIYINSISFILFGAAFGFALICDIFYFFVFLYLVHHTSNYLLLNEFHLMCMHNKY